MTRASALRVVHHRLVSSLQPARLLAPQVSTLPTAWPQTETQTQSNESAWLGSALAAQHLPLPPR